MPSALTHATPEKFTGIKGYFLAVFDGVFSCLKGMQITLKYWNFLVSFRPLGIQRQRLITLQYPDEIPDVQVGYRGKHVYVKARCIACRMGERACPVDCIAMDIEGKGKNAILHHYTVDYSKCLLCNLCSEACPVDCLWLGTQYDLTAYARSACIVELIDESNAALEMPERCKVAKPPKPPKPARPESAAGARKPAGGDAAGPAESQPE